VPSEAFYSHGRIKAVDTKVYAFSRSRPHGFRPENTVVFNIAKTIATTFLNPRKEPISKRLTVILLLTEHWLVTFANGLFALIIKRLRRVMQWLST
jgi:hypothetical protein